MASSAQMRALIQQEHGGKTGQETSVSREEVRWGAGCGPLLPVLILRADCSRVAFMTSYPGRFSEPLESCTRYDISRLNRSQNGGDAGPRGAHAPGGRPAGRDGGAPSTAGRSAAVSAGWLTAPLGSARRAALRRSPWTSVACARRLVSAACLHADAGGPTPRRVPTPSSAMAKVELS